MALRIIRNGHTVDANGIIHYDDTPVSIEKIEELAGRKLDRRKSYAVVEGVVCDSAQWSQPCSGCSGTGCHECGYHGNVRCGQWIPLSRNI